MSNLNKARAIAFYLPQYHPIPENDLWWGKGFTEWTNVAKAKPLFKNHQQPNLPSDLGFYDLRVPEIRAQQAAMAEAHGIEGFCYWHYWFGNGKQLLQRPFDEVLASGEPNFPFCLGWANETWTGIWHGNPKKVLIQQEYLGIEDDTAHFYYLLKAFKDSRYIKVDGKPLFVINAPEKLPDINAFTTLFRDLAMENGLSGLYIVANTGLVDWDPNLHGCDAVNLILHGNLYRGIPDNKRYLYAKYKNQFIKNKWLNKCYVKLRKRPVQVYDYEDVAEYLTPKVKPKFDFYPCVLPNWDNSPRSGIRSMIFKNPTPAAFDAHLKNALRLIEGNADDKKILFVKSWNEWAEGNYLEPDQKHGFAFLNVLKRNIKENT
ncbi:glycosyltransferase WbsX family protein [Pedobacter sandarakinus]|uniref:glycosyltransferase WbsX family protein n=1 Tax=Pedobacter sandarakinus TaxID=353156 RepID=UPI002245A54E|nr:glycoside hydrolase family 99-like domain-containing protein [Pedobacter sandarakinus]MCX2575928.1 glycoside hydrolase family 99-like domain-containing protein [Pedobacter sandarakinus]